MILSLSYFGSVSPQLSFVLPFLIPSYQSIFLDLNISRAAAMLLPIIGSFSSSNSSSSLVYTCSEATIFDSSFISSVFICYRSSSNFGV